MPITTTTTIYRRDGTSETLDAHQALYRTQMQPREWSFQPPAPLGWEFEVPRYRVTRDLKPAQKARFRFEPPFSETWESDCWQYGEKPLTCGAEISTTDWPHSSMRPLNFSAEKVLAFFNGAMKSRLTVSPWHGDQVRLDNGLSNVPMLTEVKSPKLQPMNLRPVA
jgi:hypothetical protein